MAKLLNKMIEKATLANGCFWCTETIFSRVRGVLSVMPGYSGGTIKNPSYREVCNGSTGHAECVQVEYDNTQIDFASLLEVFFDTHDPTTLNKQGKYTPGTHIKIISPENGMNNTVDYAFLGAWNFKKEIFKKERDFIKSGGKFITHIPYPKII